jgi:5'-nucleotidase/UDP-sugar diphosphatase
MFTKKYALFVVLLLFFISVIASELEFTIIHTNDHHGNPFNYTVQEMEVAGLAERAFIINDIKKDLENFLILDAGDINTGKPESMFFDARPDIAAYNLIGYDAMTIGNHEFYEGFERLQKQMQWAEFPFLSANIFYKNDEYIGEPYIIKTLSNGLKIAVIGLTTTTIKRSLPMLSNELIIKDEVEVAKELIPYLKQNADIIIALTHLGISPDEDHSYGSLRLANEVPEIDIIIDGHSHTYMDKPLIINDIPILQASDRGKFLGVGQFIYSNDKVVVKNWKAIPLMRRRNEPLFESNQTVADTLAIYKEKVYAKFNEIIGFSDSLYSVQNIRNQLLPLGSIICDALLNVTKNMNTLFAMSNGGGIRADLPKGNIRYFNIFDMLPFDNTITIVELKGKTVKDIVNFSMNKMINTGGFLQYSTNVKLIQSDNESWDVLVNNNKIVDENIYRIAVNSYISSGGDNYFHFNEALSIDNIGYTEKEAMREYILTNEMFKK